MNATLRLAAAALVTPLLLLAGCGLVAAPHPPSLKLPQPVSDLTAQRTADQVTLHWTMPKRTTDKVLLAGPQKVQICRRIDSGPCTIAGTLLAPPEKPAAFTDQLPAALTTGTPRPLVYTIELQNRSGRTAGPSNTAITAAGPAPPPIANLEAHAQTDGIVLTWTPESVPATIRIERKLADKTAPQESSSASSIPPVQTLEFSGPEQGRVLDPDAALDHTYTYTAQRVAKLTLQDKPIEVASAPSDTITIDARDVFPPATPSGLQAVADSEAHSIDLSWQPDTEADLAGYNVYRRDAASTAEPARISPPAQPVPSFRDTTAQPGHPYEYSVSATDRDGNESPRSPEVEESLPQQ
jgi:hypothetical protein